jgi:hypothetical protein
MSKSFTNHTGVTASGFHWDLYGLYTVISINAG